MIYAQTVEFRFKTPEISQDTPVSQSLLINNGINTFGSESIQFGVVLEYTGSLTSGSYSGSILDPYYQYGSLKFILPEISSSASVYLPFFNNNWWSVAVTKTEDFDNQVLVYNLYAASKTLDEYGQYVIQYQNSSSLTCLTDWRFTGSVQLPGSGSSTILGKTYVPATGSFQELRYYNVPLSESQFDDYVLNSNSIEGNTLDSSYDELFFRAALGGELFTGSTSIHPSVNTTASFISGNSNFGYTGSYSFISNTEVRYYDQVPAGIQNAVSQKIQQQNVVLPYSSSKNNIPNSKVLSPFISIQQSPSISQSYTRNIDYVEVGFSPQNEINEDINDQLGYFNIGEFIGDPRQQSSPSVSYPDLDGLRDSYFKKYFKDYQEWDYIRLIQFFDNSLFKTVADWIPARASLASGIIIKQHLLERNKYPVPQAEISTSIANVASGSTNIPFYQENILFTGSIPMGTITGSDGGTLPNMNGQTSSVILPGNYNTTVTQVWSGSNLGPLGIVPFIDSYQTEFFDGELSGSVITVTNGELNNCSVELLELYNNSSLGTVISTVTTDYNGPTLRIPYNVNNDNVYFLSFSYNNLDLGSSISVIDNTGKIFLNIIGDLSNTPSGTILTTQINNPEFPLGFRSTDFSGCPITNLSLFESYIEPDCLVIANNAPISRFSSKYFDVDYSQQNILPVNQQVILSQSATYAQVQDSNYTLARNINPRYVGSKNTSAKYNTYTVGDSSYGKTAAIDNYVNYFAYFDYIADGSTYIGGSNIHVINLIDIEGNIITLTPENINLFNIEQIFKQGDPVYAYQISGTSTTALPEMTIVTGGALYTTILVKSGSGDLSGASLQITPGGTGYITQFISGSNPPTTSSLILNSPIAGTPNWLDWIISGSTFDSVTSYTPINGGLNGRIQIYNKLTLGLSSENTNVEDTLFPLQYGDFIRFGDSSATGASITSSLDYSWNNGNLYNILTTNTNNLVAPLSSSLQVTPAAHSYPQLVSNQAFRIIRRVPNETFVVISQAIDATSGLLIPYNFNPDYSPAEIAKKAGLIQ